MAKELTPEQLARIADTRARLKAWREKHAPNRTKFAADVGCTPGMIAFLESGEDDKLPGVAIAFAIERATSGAITAADWAPLADDDAPSPEPAEGTVPGASESVA